MEVVNRDGVYYITDGTTNNRGAKMNVLKNQIFENAIDAKAAMEQLKKKEA